MHEHGNEGIYGDPREIAYDEPVSTSSGSDVSRTDTDLRSTLDVFTRFLDTVLNPSRIDDND